jgi:hypothetical protein
MERHMWGSYAGGVAGMRPFCEILKIGIDPASEPVTYQTVGFDLDGAPIEAGFGRTELTWGSLSQEDYGFLLDYQGDVPGTEMYVRAQKRNGVSGIEFANYTAMVGRPTFDSREALVVHNVRIPLTMMVEL